MCCYQTLAARCRTRLEGDGATAMLGVEGIVDGAKHTLVVVALKALAPIAHLGGGHSLALGVLEVVVEAVDGAVNVIRKGIALTHTQTVKFPHKQRCSVGGALSMSLGDAVLDHEGRENGHELVDLLDQVGVGGLDGAVAAVVVGHDGDGDGVVVGSWWMFVCLVCYGIVVSS
ncbi:hypothetical protein F5X68DRAFT_216987 [Plectosphaerella plurivora]|uniref:Uncharacterized protein n=1 Tax=Plectosphaerella plurivora TaxID=936078 RepID=A0A9P9A5J0_9PEZI|nr:hypothetical protein F5X68DRAFT_216987 [Plectosphaerella plurivora]